MDITKLMPGLAVSQQVAASDLQTIKAAGFRAIVCNQAGWANAAVANNLSDFSCSLHLSLAPSLARCSA
ncbi:hypothetical protein PQR75_28550 [Paraburkholderia fungorum]|jgi:hypothetical protein|uniref:hypothetical protein n=1 Tax=Paraburkholderia fungorum TaxID=134537 RepID=UPI0038B71BE4